MTAQKGLAQLHTHPGNTNRGYLKWIENVLKWGEPCPVWRDDIFPIKHTSDYNNYYPTTFNNSSTNASNTDASSATNDTNTTNTTNATNKTNATDTTDTTDTTTATNTSNAINTGSRNWVGHRWEVTEVEVKQGHLRTGNDSSQIM